jgi:hypothetical protein
MINSAEAYKNIWMLSGNFGCNGLYAGTATLDVNPNLVCAREMPIGGFRVAA